MRQLVVGYLGVLEFQDLPRRVELAIQTPFNRIGDDSYIIQVHAVQGPPVVHFRHFLARVIKDLLKHGDVVSAIVRMPEHRPKHMAAKTKFAEESAAASSCWVNRDQRAARMFLNPMIQLQRRFSVSWKVRPLSRRLVCATATFFDSLP